MKFHPGGMLALAKKAWGEEYEVRIAIGAEGAPPPFALSGGLAVVDVKGPLKNHRHPCWDSYEAIVERVGAALAEGQAERVVMRIDSPGGDVDGCFDAARALRAMAKKAGKPLEAYADGMAASAAYALACAATGRILVSSTSTVGSIGIIEGMRSQVAADRAMGQDFVLVASGEHKADGNPHVPITDKAVANLQAQVDSMADLFFDLVEELRGFPAEKARALEARMLFGEQAVGAGLADAVITWSSLAHAVPSAHSGAGADMAAKAMNLRQHMAWAAEHGDDEEKETAKKCLALFEEGEDDDEEKKEPEKKEGKAEGKKAEAEPKEKEEKEAKAEAEPEKKEAKKAEAGEEKEEKAEGKKAAAMSGMAARLQALEAAHQEREDAIKRAAMMATRPDLAPEVVAWLDAEPLETVARALKTLPKGKALASPRQAAAASQAMGTRGAGHIGDPADVSFAPDDVSGFIARKMGVEVAGPGIKNTGKALELGFMTPEQARDFLTKRASANSAAGGK